MKLTARLQEGALSALKTPAPPAKTKLVSIASASAQNGKRPSQDKQ
jgi:hypothetical protein